MGTTTSKRSGGNPIKYNPTRKYKLRNAKSAWMLFNAHHISVQKKDHPERKLGECTKESGRVWNKMSEDDKSEWFEKSSVEKLKREQIKKTLEKNGNDFSKVSGRWLAIDKAKEKEANGKTSPKKKKVVKKKTKTKKNEKKKK